MTGKPPPNSSKGTRSEPHKLPHPDKGLIAKPSSRADINVGNISDVSGTLNFAGGDIINTIQTIYQRALTPGEASEKDLQIEVNELARCVREYLDRLKQQMAAPASSEPYKGLTAYTFSEAQLFFGRDQAIRDLRQAMKRNPLTILQAESGAGKTSLLQAGILPRLIADGQLAILVRPGTEHPTEIIKSTFIGNPESTPRLSRAPLVDFLRRVSEIIGYQTTLYLILDQFEEFFSKKTLEQDRQQFIEDLAACLNDTTLNVRWIIAITTDVFGQLGKFEPQVKNPFSNAQSLYLFTRKEAAEVIAKPAEKQGLSFEDGLLDRLLDDLDQNHIDAIAPTQIQLVCAALYDDIREQGHVFTRDCYEQRGGAQGILRNYLARTLNNNLPQAERATAYRIFETLVTSEKKRVIRDRADLETALKGKGISVEVAESTLNHLVQCRLLRRLGDDEQHLRYEIVHDYLLGEIEIDEGVRHAKEAVELLEQGTRNWERQKLLLAPDALQIIEDRADDISISSVAATLLFFSAVQYNRPAERWRDLMSSEDQKSLTIELLHQKNSRASREALWLLRQGLSTSQQAKVAFARTSRALGAMLGKTINVLLVAKDVLLVILIIINIAYFVPWTRVTSFDKQCLDGRNSPSLLIAVDAADSSRVVAYDSQSGRLCQTFNTGARWAEDNRGLPPDLRISSIAINSIIYLASDQGIFYQKKGAAWERLDLPVEDQSIFRKIAIDSDQETLYLSTSLNRLYAYNLASGKWDPIDVAGLTGTITDITVNYDYRAVSTLDGIWYQQIGLGKGWQKYDFKSEGPVTITSIKLVHPLKSWRHYFYDPTDDDWFFASTERGDIYSGNLTEPQRLEKRYPGQISISALAVNGYSKFSVKSDGLYCEQSWSIVDKEWWLYRMSSVKPCN